MNTLLIESNRAIANSLVNDNYEENIGLVDSRHKRIENKASWTTSIDTGIELNPGDKISMEACALNVTGAGGGDFLQFNGSSDTPLPDGSFKNDNKAQLEIAYYINNNAQFNVPLPSGSCSTRDLGIDASSTLNISSQFGEVDLTGKQIWGVNLGNQEFPTLVGFSTLNNNPGSTTVYEPPNALSQLDPTVQYYYPTTSSQGSIVYGYWSFQDGWSMNRNGYFSTEMDAASYVPPSGTVTQAEVENTFDYLGYLGWIDNTSWLGVTGTQFGQQNTAFDSTVNENILNKDSALNRTTQAAQDATTTSSGDPDTRAIPEIQGGSAPYQVVTNFSTGINGVLPQMQNANARFGMYRINNAGINGFIPKDFPEFSVGDYQDIVSPYPTTFKGGGANHRPNGNRLYCSNYQDSTKTNFGPFYSNSVQNCIQHLSANQYPALDHLDFNVYNRDEHYFHFMTETIDIDLGVGNLAPSRVAEIITEQLKLRETSMTNPNYDENISIGGEIFNIDVASAFIKENVPQFVGKSYKTYPTMNGLCWNAKAIYPIGSTQKEAWRATEYDEILLNQSNLNVPPGQGYLSDQAYEKYYKIMLAGNPFEWAVVCKLHPMLQACPFTLGDTANASFLGRPLNYNLFSILSGFDVGTTVNRKLPRTASSGVAQYTVGNLGCFPCIINNTKLRNKTQAVAEGAYAQSWYCGTFVASKSHISGAVLGDNYNIESLRTKNYQVYDEPINRPVLAIADLDIIPTNIVFDGQVSLALFDENMETIKQNGNRFAGTDTLESQSSTFFNNTYVEWVMGRIDDQYSYPENESIDMPKELLPSNTGGAGKDDIRTGSQIPPRPFNSRKGTPIFLPNIFQTHLLYNNNIGIASSATADCNTNGQAIFDNTVMSRVAGSGGTTTSGSYMLRNMRVGYNSSVSSDYTATQNPQSVFNKGNSGTLFDFTAGTKTEANANKFFGIPSWTTYEGDFNNTENSDTKTAYQKGMRRSIHGYRYLPQDKAVKFTSQSAFRQEIPLGVLQNEFTTCPVSFTFNQIDFIWKNLAKLNKGLGIGCIPIFYKSVPTLLATSNFNEAIFLEIPFLGIIAQGQSYDNIPLPLQGEYIMLGSTPSLSQNDLSHPATTQQSNYEKPAIEKDPTLEYIPNYVGINNFKPNEVVPSNSATQLFDLKQPTKQQQQAMMDCNSGKQISNIVYTGANDPIMNYDTTFNRFAISNLHTQMFKGNGVFQLASFGPNTNPNTIERLIKSNTAAFSQQVELPACAFQKFDDPRPTTLTTVNLYSFASGNVWKSDTVSSEQFNFTDNTGTRPNGFVFDGTYQRTSPPSANIIYIKTTQPGNGLAGTMQFDNNTATPVWTGTWTMTLTGGTQGFAQIILNATTASGATFTEDFNSSAALTIRSSSDNASDQWTIFQLELAGASDPLGKGFDRYIPGRLTKNTFGESGKYTLGILPLMVNSIEGNTIRQTFSFKVNGPGGYIAPYLSQSLLVGNLALNKQAAGNLVTNNFEPGGMSSITYVSGTPPGANGMFIGNCLPYTPYNTTQFTLRCQNEESLVIGKNNKNDSTPNTDRNFLLSPTLRPFAYVTQDSRPYQFNSAQGGVGIIGLNILKTNGQSIKLTSSDYTLYEGSMFHKLGYNLNQILPLFSKVQNQFNHTLFNKFAGSDKSANEANENMVFPLTTNSLNTSSAIPGAVSGFGTAAEDANRSQPNTLMPMFNLGGAWASSAVTANSDAVIALRLPSRLSFPYLVLRSNIATPTTNQYIGGANGKQMLPAISYLMTSYASDDFFYNYRSDLVFTVTKPYVLTEIKSSIHFPNGKLAEDVLGDNTAVIYRIDFAEKYPAEDESFLEKELNKDKK